MINFNKVTKKFPLGVIALDNASFKIDDEFVFLVGASGAGKTTILKLILREYLPTSGIVEINDFEVSSKKFKQVEKLRQRIGIVFQDFKVLHDKNVFENIAISVKICKVNGNEIKHQVKEMLKLVSLQD